MGSVGFALSELLIAPPVIALYAVYDGNMPGIFAIIAAIHFSAPLTLQNLIFFLDSSAFSYKTWGRSTSQKKPSSRTDQVVSSTSPGAAAGSVRFATATTGGTAATENNKESTLIAVSPKGGSVVSSFTAN